MFAGNGLVSAALYVVMLIFTVNIAERLPRRSARPVATVGLWLAVAVPSVLGLLIPAVYAALYRDPPLVLAGQWWRVITSIAVQDGGLAGAAFNLVALAAVGFLAERAWGPGRMLAIAAVGGIPLNIVAVAFGSAGGGNSGMTFALATSLAGLAAVSSTQIRTRLLALGPVAVGAVLCFLGDAHGIAMLVGVVIGAVAALVRPVGPVSTGPSRADDGLTRPAEGGRGDG